MGRLQTDCMLCILRKQLNQIPRDTKEEKKLEFLQRMFRVFAEAPMDAGAPLIVRDINRIKKEMFGFVNEYGEIKKYFNEFMLSYEKKIANEISKSIDPLKSAIQYAMVGNYIDFGAMKNVDEKQLDEIIQHAQQYKIKEDEYNNIKKDLQAGKNFLFITDNCGEIVMDKLLLKVIKENYPNLDISILVRGEPVLNDVTMEDIKQVGLYGMFPIYENGTGVAGTSIAELPEEALEVFEKADVIFSKGQGNFETLRYCGRNIYYIFLCKCDLFAEQFQVPKFTGVVLNDRNLN